MSASLNISSPSYVHIAVAALTILLSGCIPVLEQDPLSTSQRVIDDRLVGNWVSRDGERLVFEERKAGLEIIVENSGDTFIIPATSGNVGDISLISADLSLARRGGASAGRSGIDVQPKGTFLVFRYEFLSDRELQITPLDMEFIEDKIAAGEIVGTVDNSCYASGEPGLIEGKAGEQSTTLHDANFVLFCPRLDLSPSTAGALIGSGTDDIFEVDETFYLDREGQ